MQNNLHYSFISLLFRLDYNATYTRREEQNQSRLGIDKNSQNKSEKNSVSKINKNAQKRDRKKNKKRKKR